MSIDWNEALAEIGAASSLPELVDVLTSLADSLCPGAVVVLARGYHPTDRVVIHANGNIPDHWNVTLHRAARNRSFESGGPDSPFFALPLAAGNIPVGALGVGADPDENVVDAFGPLIPVLGSLVAGLDFTNLQEQAESKSPPGEVIFTNKLVGGSSHTDQLKEWIGTFGPTELSMLILGEPGSGKEVVARCLHDVSPRRTKAFIAVNCSAIPENLFESEFFGYVPGAFNEAKKKKRGFFEQADGGTLFLDEIGDMRLHHQVAILRAIQEKCIRPVGGEEEIQVNVRIISATNRNIGAMVNDETFRDDLYFRIAEETRTLLPLCDHKEDLPQLVAHFVAAAARKQQCAEIMPDPAALEAIDAYDWPGNVRELQSAIRRGFIVAHAKGDIKIRPEHLRLHSEIAKKKKDTGVPTELLTLREMECYQIEQVMRRCENVKLKASELLGVSRQGLDDKIKRCQKDKQLT